MKLTIAKCRAFAGQRRIDKIIERSMSEQHLPTSSYGKTTVLISTSNTARKAMAAIVIGREEFSW